MPQLFEVQRQLQELQGAADEVDTLKLELLEARREIQELQRRARTWQVSRMVCVRAAGGCCGQLWQGLRGQVRDRRRPCITCGEATFGRVSMPTKYMHRHFPAAG